MNVQSCFMSTFISINIARLFRPANPQMAKIIISIKVWQKKGIIFLFTCLIHRILCIFQSVRQKKGNIHNKTNEYRWHFRSKPHQTASLIQILTMLFYFGECAHAAAHVNATASVWFYCVNNIPSDRCSRLYGSAAAQRPHSSRVLTWVVKSVNF